MIKVGLTGGIGSGKTTVAGILKNLGIPVFVADKEARNLMESSPELISSIKAAFGDEAYNENGLNRAFIAGIVFSDPLKLKKLNMLTHPAVHRHFESWALQQKDVPYIVEEAALLYETGAWKYFDYIVLVTAPKRLRIERVISRDNTSEEEVLKRMDSQMPEEDKVPLAHFLIFNDEKSLVLNQVLTFHEKMISLSKK